MFMPWLWRPPRARAESGQTLFPLLTITMLVSLMLHCTRAEDNCSTQSHVSGNREPGQYQSGSVQIQLQSKDLGSPVSVLKLCLIKDGALCYPKSTELAAFLQYIQGELIPEGRSGGKSTDPDDLFYDDPDEDAKEAAVDRELQQQLVESSDGLRSALCVSRNCDNVNHTCSPEVKPDFAWDYYNFNQIRTKIKQRRKDPGAGGGSESRNSGSGTESGNNGKKSEAQRLQLSLTMIWITRVLVRLLNISIGH